jgi:hypothetical protein
LTHRFEVLVVDDASSDHTVELARELACQYPQLRLIRHRQPLGADAAVKTGLQWAQSNTVFVVEETALPSPADLRRLWSLRADDQVVMARAETKPGVVSPALLERLSTWGQALKSLAAGGGSLGGIQLIRRDAAEQIAAGHAPQREPAALPVAAIERSRSDPSHPAAQRPRQATTFLRHLRDLALGE